MFGNISRQPENSSVQCDAALPAVTCPSAWYAVTPVTCICHDEHLPNILCRLQLASRQIAAASQGPIADSVSCSQSSNAAALAWSFRMTHRGQVLRSFKFAVHCKRLLVAQLSGGMHANCAIACVRKACLEQRCMRHSGASFASRACILVTLDVL